VKELDHATANAFKYLYSFKLNDNNEKIHLEHEVSTEFRSGKLDPSNYRKQENLMKELKKKKNK